MPITDLVPNGGAIARALAARDGDAAEYRRLLSNVAGLARRVAQRTFTASRFSSADVDDVVQETLLAVHLKLRAWNGEHPLETWAARVARNKAVDVMRGARAQSRRSIEDFEDQLASPFGDAVDAHIDVSKLIGRLPPRARAIVTAIALGGESAEEVAERLSISNGAVRVALHRAIRAMTDETVARPNRRALH